MDFELSEEQRAFAETARAFALSAFAPHAATWDAEAIFPKAAIAKAGELGFCGLYAPEAAGGLALPRLDKLPAPAWPMRSSTSNAILRVRRVVARSTS